MSAKSDTPNISSLNDLLTVAYQIEIESTPDKMCQ